MKLETYLTVTRTKREAFAARLGVKRQALWRLLTGKTTATLDMMRRIAIETDGQVMPNDFLDDHPDPDVSSHETRMTPKPVSRGDFRHRGPRKAAGRRRVVTPEPVE